MMLSTADLTRLETASRLLVSPLLAPDPTAWIVEAGEAVRALVGGDRVVFQLAETGVPYFSDDAPDIVDELMTFVKAVQTEGIRFSDPIVDLWNELRRAQNVGTFTWDINRTMVEAHGHDMFDAPIVADVLQGNGHNDFAGMYGRTPAGESMIWVLHRRHGSLAFGEHTAAVLGAVLPAYHAGLETLSRFGAQRAALDAVAEPLAVFSPDGLEIHRNAALSALLAADPERRAIETQLGALGRRAAQPDRPLAGLSPEASVATARGRYAIRASALPPGFFGGDPTVMVSVAAEVAPSLPDADAVRARLGLTRRESEVALLLAEGLTNAAVAERLFVSPHTARHHVENVLAKLNLSSRAAVARRLVEAA